MPTYKAQALILKKTKLGETDLIITLIDESGTQRRAVAKGARKPSSFMSGRAELYMLVDAQFSTGRSLDILTDVRVIEAHSGCRCDIEHSAAAAVPAEFVDQTTSSLNAEPLLYEMTSAVLGHIETAEGNAPYLLSLACILKLCAALGVRPSQHELLGVSTQTGEWVDRLLHARFADLVSCTGDEYLPLIQDLVIFSERWLAEHLNLRLKSLAFMKDLL